MYDYSFRLDNDFSYLDEPDDFFMDIINHHLEDEIFDKELDFQILESVDYNSCPLDNDEEYWNWIFSLEEIYGNEEN